MCDQNHRLEPRGQRPLSSAVHLAPLWNSTTNAKSIHHEGARRYTKKPLRFPLCTFVSFVVSAVSWSWLLFRLWQCVRVGHALRDRGVSGAHRSHIARSKASHASAGSQTQFRRTCAAADPSTFRARGEQFAFRIARHTDNHPRHVVGDIEGMLRLACLQGTIGGSLRLCFRGVDVQPSAIRGGVSAVFLQLELHGVRRLGRSGTRRRRGLRGVRLTASCQYKE